MIIIIFILILFVLLSRSKREHFNEVYFSLDGEDILDKNNIDNYHCIVYHCPDKSYDRQTACLRCMLKSDLKNLFMFS